MTLWLVRAGQHGEHEQRFLDSDRLYITWPGLEHDLAQIATKQELQGLLQHVYPNDSRKRVINHSSQLWPFVHEMEPADWVVVPSKMKPAIHIAEIRGPYVFDAAADDPYYHYRDAKWIVKDVPRSNFDQDLLYSFGAFMTICRVKRNDAESRVRAMGALGWTSAPISPPPADADEADDDDGPIDLERLARDAIAKLVIQRFKGHAMARLIEAVLKAQGYTTHLSPEGPDKGIDILAAPGPLGFGTPRLCVQVKSGDSPVERQILDQLIGAMQNVRAEQGLLVSWGGFKSSVDRERAVQFFNVRLWDQDDVIDQVLASYDELGEEFRAELPLKRIWTVTPQDEPE